MMDNESHELYNEVLRSGGHGENLFLYYGYHWQPMRSLNVYRGYYGNRGSYRCKRESAEAFVYVEIVCFCYVKLG